MRIAFLVGIFPALSETFILNQITGLLDRGVDLEIIALNRGDTVKMHDAVARYDLLKRTFYTAAFSRWRGVRLVNCAILLLEILFRRGVRVFLKTLFLCLRANRTPLPRSVLLSVAGILMKRGKFDVVHGHFGQHGQILAELRELGIIRGKVFATFYGGDVLMATARYGPGCYSTLFQTGDCVFALSNFMKTQLIQLGCPAEKLHVHHLGIDCHRFQRKTDSRNQHSSIRLLSVCRLVEKKGLEYAIRAFSLVEPEHPDCCYHIVGEGPLRVQLEQLVSELNLKNHVQLLGSMTQEKILEFFEASDVFILPSVTGSDGDQEGTPTVLIEALAMELPVLSTRHAGVPEVVPDGRAGYLVEERDYVNLSIRLRELTAHPSRRKCMGDFGRQHVLKEFEIGKLNDRLFAFYQKTFK